MWVANYVGNDFSKTRQFDDSGICFTHARNRLEYFPRREEEANILIVCVVEERKGTQLDEAQRSIRPSYSISKYVRWEF